MPEASDLDTLDDAPENALPQTEASTGVPLIPEGEDSPLDFLGSSSPAQEVAAPSFEDTPPPTATPARNESLPDSIFEDDGDDPLAVLASQGIKQERNVPRIIKPWMRFHEFVIIKSIEELSAVVDRALVTGKCSLDLETQGLDNRIYNQRRSEIQERSFEHWNDEIPEYVPQTVHKIVGYCLSVDGKTGYYVPVRHTAEDSNNVDPAAAGREIKRLCLASQPVLTEVGLKEDPLASRQIATPGKVKIYFWNAKFDQEFLYPVTGLDYWHPDSFEDGMLLFFCRITGDKSLSLKDKAPQELFVKDEKGVLIPYEMIELRELFVNSRGQRREIKFATLHPEECKEYACSDAICTFLLCDREDLAALARDPRYTNMYRLEKQVSQVVRVMERNRIKIDKAFVSSLFEEARKEADLYRSQIVSLAEQHGFHGFNPGSSEQLSDFLFTDRGLNISPKPDVNENSGQYKTDADTLEKLVEDNPASVNPILLTVVKFRQVERVVTSYLTQMLANCDKNDELRTGFKQVGAPTARFSTPKPKDKNDSQGHCGFPFHGLPATYDEKKPKVATALRRAIVARPGYTMVKVDYAGEELRIATNLSRESVWIKEFLEGSGDLHSITARAFFNKLEVSKQERQQGKIANFSLVYGGGSAAIMRATGCNQQEAARRKANFDKAMPAFAKWTKGQKDKVKKDKGVFTAFGRWISLPEIDSPDRAVVAAIERCSINYPVQGTGADIMKMCLVMLHKEFYKRGWLQKDIVRMLLTVHDEIVFEVKHEYLVEAMGVIEKIMTEPGRMARWEVPLVVEPLIDLSWDAKYDYHMVMHGRPVTPKDREKLKKNEIIVEEKVYQKVPEWLEAYLVPDWKRLQAEGVTGPVSEPEPEAVVGSDEPASAPTHVVVNSTTTSSEPISTPVTLNGKSNGAINVGVHTCPITRLTRDALKYVAAACMLANDPHHGKVLHLVDAITGETVIDPSLNIRIDPEEFERRMREHGLM